MNDFSVSMALVDYIPVIFFISAAAILLRDLYDKMVKGLTRSLPQVLLTWG